MGSADCSTARLGGAFLALVALALALLAGPLYAQSTKEPLILVAVPKLSGFYQQSVLIAVPVAGNRHVGFIINRPTEVSMARLFPGHDASRKVASPIFLGGPEMVTSVFAMLKATDTPEGKTFAVMPGVQVVAEAKSIDKIIEQTPNAARYYAGFVAWQPGELAQELERGFWFTMSAQPDLMFREDVGGMWEELLERAQRVRTRLPAPDDRWELGPPVARILP